MDNMAYKLHETPEETSREAPPPYSSISSPIGVDQLSTLSRVDVRQKNVTTEHGEVVFGLKRELVKKMFSYAIIFDLYDKAGRNAVRLKPVNACCNPRLEVHIGGQYVAKLIMKSFVNVTPKYVVSDAAGNKELMIYTPALGERGFLLRIKDMQGNQIGTVNKKWNGLVEEAFADSNELQVDFPRDLGVQYKATIIGFCIVLIQEANLQLRHNR